MGKIEKIVRKLWAEPLFCKTILRTKKIRIFCDGGYPIFRWFPKFYRIGYNKYWGMIGFWVSLWGRQIFFSFGLDKNGLYKRS